MTGAPRATVDPFAHVRYPITEPDPVHDVLRAAGPLVRAEAPAGGPVWIVTEERLAREVLADGRIVKDPAFAPPQWNRWSAGLEPTAAERPSLTTLDGPLHQQLRRAHGPLLSARRVHRLADRIATIVRGLLAELAAAEGPVDLTADFTTRFPLSVVCDLVGVPLDRVDAAMAACRGVLTSVPEEFAAAMRAIDELVAAALEPGAAGLAAELRERVPAEITEPQLRYLLFGLVFAGQITTESVLGFLLARVLADGPADLDVDDIDTLVRDVLREHPPAPFTLWRFTSEEVELAGVRLKPRTPVLVDIQGVNTAPDRTPGPDLTFGAGAHYCIGAQLAQLELHTAVQVISSEYPDARLAVPYDELEITSLGITGRRLGTLPVRLRG
jgi:cytochrome P450